MTLRQETLLKEPHNLLGIGQNSLRYSGTTKITRDGTKIAEQLQATLWNVHHANPTPPIGPMKSHIL